MCGKALYKNNVSMAQGWGGCSLYCDRAAALAVVPSWNKGGPWPLEGGEEVGSPRLTESSEVGTLALSVAQNSPWPHP